MEKPEEKKELTPEEKEKQAAINAIVFRQKRQGAFLQSLEGGVSVLKASKAAVIDYKTIWRWRKDDEEFNLKVMAILDSRIMIVEDALFLNAAKGNLGAQKYYLNNRSKGRWKETVTEIIDLNINKGIEFDEYKTIKEMTDDEREMLISRLSQVCGSQNDKSDTKDKTENKG